MTNALHSQAKAPRSCHKTGWQAAFSLVETVLALGVVSICLLGVIGLLPTGLNSMRQAMDITLEAQIVRHLSSETLLTPYADLEALYSNKTFYFDQDGIEIVGGGSVPPNGVKYIVNTRVLNPVYPGSETVAQTVVASSLCSIEIAFETQNAVQGSSSSGRIYHLEIANNGN